MTPAEPLTNCCPYCELAMRPSEMACESCGIGVRGLFPTAPLSSLPVEHQRFIEMFVLASGNLKEIASLAGVSYPTVRNRLDKVIEALRSAIETQPTPPTGAAIRSNAGRSTMADAANIIKRI
jgi:hypothetical protein